MKIYKDKQGILTIVYGIHEEGRVLLVRDTDTNNKVNMIGQKIDRFKCKWANVDDWVGFRVKRLKDLLKEEERHEEYVLKKVVKVRKSTQANKKRK